LEGLSELELKKRRLREEYEKSMRLLENDAMDAEVDEADEAEADPLEVSERSDEEKQEGGADYVPPCKETYVESCGTGGSYYRS
jgi:hypothetical protein